MNIEFHYYAVHYLCTAAGLSAQEAETVAGSSQLVDDILVSLDIHTEVKDYRVQATQNYRFWSAEIQREVYMPFHFVPGDRAKARSERNGDADEGVVTPDSPNARTLLIAALRTDDLFRIGIALHAYADTWAHQHFSGIAGSTNIVDPASLLPPAGHLQVLGAPDDPGGTWEDGRLVPDLRTVVNSERFLAAARKIYRFLCTWRRRPFVDEDFVLDALGQIWSGKRPGESAHEAKKARIGAYIVDLGIPPRERGLWMTEAGISDPARNEDPFGGGYDRLTWLKSTLAGTLFGQEGGSRGDSGTAGKLHHTDAGLFFGSRLHRWSEAADAHRTAAKTLFDSGGSR